MLALYLKGATECMEGVVKLPTRKFNNEQCVYLADKLKLVVQSASLFLEVLSAEYNGPGSSKELERRVEIFKLLFAMAKEIESFIQGCCKDEWIQAAMTLTNMPEYVAALGFNLELCRVSFGPEHAASRRLTLDQVANIDRDEVELVQKKASMDVKTLLQNVLFELAKKSLSSEENDLVIYLLQRLARIKLIRPSESSWCSVNDDEGFLKRLFKWVKPMERLGKGASSIVYKAMWLGTPVAKKMFMGPGNADFTKEVEILASLGHPNITSMFCYMKDKRSCSILMELMDEDLHDLMHRRCGGTDSPPFTFSEALDIMLQVGEGVNYLHQNGFVHRDLKSLNILVKSVKTSEVEGGYVHVKVADFGLSKTKDSSTRYTNQTLNTGTSRWMAPEIINLVVGSRGSTSSEPKYPFKADVYSFGMVCYEILTGYVPFFEEELPNKVKEKVMKGERPDLPDQCPHGLKALIKKCWNPVPEERPSFQAICLELKHLKYLLMMVIGQKTGRPDWESGVSSPRFVGMRDDNLHNVAANDLEAQADERVLVPHNSINSRTSEGFDDFEGDETSFDGSQTPNHTKSEAVRSPPQLPPLPEETASPSFEDNDPPPGIVGLRIVGDPVLGGRLTACGHCVNGTYLCIFQWIRHYEDGTASYIEGAAKPEYLITADDCDNVLGVECIPMDEHNRKGDVMKVMVNDGYSISRDSMMQAQVDRFMTNGQAVFEVSLLEGRSEVVFRPATLILRPSTYELRCNNGRKQLVNAVFIKIPVGEYSQFIITCQDGKQILLELQDPRSRDLAVLTFRAFLKAAVDKKARRKWLRG